MAKENQKRLAFFLLALLAVLPSASAQNKEQADSLVRFVKGSSIQLIEKFGKTYRKAVDATFLHNGTYLICDTALWNVDQKLINAEGNVQIIQDETILTSERLDYLIEENLAQFRGTLVQLKDKQNNTLRTRYLDYNTKDSLAVFKNGGAMKDKDGQIIESQEGTYDSKAKKFNFLRNVNMFTDSVFVKTNELEYDTETSKATFKTYIDFWKDGNMMSASRGWYDRKSETFFFQGGVHGTTRDQEAWSDSLYFYRKFNDVKMLGNAQVQDTTRNVAALADYIYYVDSLSKVTLRINAAVAMRTKEKVKQGDEEKERIDTIYFGADTLIYYTMRKCDIPEGLIKEAEGRVEEMCGDPVTEYRKKAAKEAAEAAAAAAAEAAKTNPNIRPNAGKKDKADVQELSPDGSPTQEEKSGPEDAPEDPADTQPQPSDSLAHAADSLALPAPDTSRIGFLEGRHNIKIFRKDIQVCADSMRYNDIDSVARFYIDPVVWNEGNRQYSSDSLFILVRNNSIDRANLMSEAFIITKEDSLCFDQIKATEVIAYFDTSAVLRRFDALGGASAFFYLQENESFATMNKVESKMLSAIFKNGDIDRVYYFDSPKNDAYPVAQLKMEDQRMRGFNWQIERRPASKEDVTSLELKPSERIKYALRPRAAFIQSDKYFPGYIESVYRGIELRDSLRRARQLEESTAGEGEKPDTLAAPVDSLKTAVADTMGIPKDNQPALPDTSAARANSQKTAAADTMQAVTGKAAEKAARKAAAEAKRKAREEARDAKWAEMDARDAAKAEAKAKRALERKRARTLKALKIKQKQEAKDAAKLERYKARYSAKKAKEDAKITQPTKEIIENGETD